MNTEIKAHFCSFSTLRMRYVAAYLLAALGGTENPEAKDIKKILESVGVDCDDERLSKVQSCVCLNIFPVFAVVIPVALRFFFCRPHKFPLSTGHLRAQWQECE